MSLFSLIFRLGTDNSDFNAGINNATARAKSAAAKMGQNFQASIGGGLKGAFAGALSVGAVVGASRHAIEVASNLQDMSDATGVSVERLQELDYALSLTGGSLDDAKKAFKELAKARAEALKNPAGDKAKAFEQFGIDLETLKNVSDPSELLVRLSDAVKGANLDLNSTPVLLELIGARAGSILPAMSMGFAEAGQQARDLGLIVSNEVNAALDDMGDRMTTLGKKANTFLAPFAKVIGDTFDTLLNGFDIISGGFEEIFVKLRTEKNVGPVGLIDAFVKGTQGRAEEQVADEAARKTAKEAAAESKRKFGNPEDEADVKAAKEVEKVWERINKKREELRLGELTPDARLKDLEAQLAAKERARGFRVDDLTPAEEEELADLRLKVQGLKKGIGEPKDTFNVKAGDQLTQVGNFLGTTGPSESERKMDMMTRYLQKIEAHTEKTSRNLWIGD